jgi:hypothetical protein
MSSIAIPVTPPTTPPTIGPTGVDELSDEDVFVADAVLDGRRPSGRTRIRTLTSLHSRQGFFSTPELEPGDTQPLVFLML